MPESTFNHPLFGPVRFRTASKLQWIRGDAISLSVVSMKPTLFRSRSRNLLASMAPTTAT